MESHQHTCVEITPVNKNEIYQLYVFHAQNFVETKYGFGSFCDFIEQKAFKLFTAKKGKIIIGYIVFLLTGPEADIVFIGVAAAYRKSGVGTKLLNVPRGTFKTKIIHAEVSSGIKTAVNFYLSAGFVITGTRHSGYYRNSDAIAYRMTRSF